MNEHKNIITIEDEIKEFSDKPVKSSALFKALEEKGLPDASEASVGDVLTKGEDGIGWSAPSGGDGGIVVVPLRIDLETDMIVSTATFEEIKTYMLSGKQVFFEDSTESDESITSIYRYPVTECYSSPSQGYIVCCVGYTRAGNVFGIQFTTDSPNGYPETED